MAPNPLISNYEGHICELTRLKERLHVLGKRWLWNLHPDIKHPVVVKAQLTVVASKDIELALHNVGSVSATRSGSILTCGHSVPVVVFDIEHMHIIHPMNTVISTEVVNLGVDQTASSADARTWLRTCYSRLYPSKCCSVKVKDVVQLAVLVRLPAKEINLFFICNCRVLEPTSWRYSICLYGT